MILQLGIVLIFFVGAVSAVISTFVGIPIGLALFFFMLMTMLSLLITWLGIKPFYRMIQMRENPNKWSKIYKVKQDGQVFEELTVNPKEVMMDKVKDQANARGVPIVGIFHRDGAIGNAIHFILEGQAKNANLLDNTPPSENSKLHNDNLFQSWNAGYRTGIAVASQDQKFFTITNIMLILALGGIGLLVGLTFQNQELLQQIFAGLGLAAQQAKIVAGVPV